MSDYIAKWHKELEIFVKVKPLIMLEGNVLDSYRYPLDGSAGKGSILRLPQYLHYYFKDEGYQNIVFYDSLNGFCNPNEGGHVERFAKLADAPVISGGTIQAEFKSRKRPSAPDYIRAALAQSRESTAVIMNFASRYIASPDNPEQSEVDSFTVLLQASMESKDVKIEGGMLKNILVMLVNKTNDIPAWFYLDNPNVKTIRLSTPGKEERAQLLSDENFASFFASDIYAEDAPHYAKNPAELAKIRDKFVALTEGFSFTEINGLRKLSKNERFRIRNLCDVVDLYKYGIRENPWHSLKIDELKNAHADFQKRVKGQDYAITKTLDVIKRAVTGLSGLQGSSHSRPKGVLFYAGPTGTGKTETAKTLAEKLFGDESCCIRFDMSEYGQSHSDQKLLGAPPGYVGYESGGQLTNKVKSNPFSILLFDEIEKAHPSIFDKFLQILEDGRMTDGQGNTVYFSECVIIFTSNLGIFVRDGEGTRKPNVTENMSYAEVRSRVRAAIEDYFKLELGRPEILNRIGENIIVFDYIRPDTARLILDAQIAKIVRFLAAEKRVNISLSDSAMRTLTDKVCGNLQNGGRGVGNIVESLLINPLSRYMFDNGIFENVDLTVEEIRADEAPVSLICSIVKRRTR